MEILKQFNLKSGHKIVVFEYRPFKGKVKVSYMVIGNGSMLVNSMNDVRKIINQGKL